MKAVLGITLMVLGVMTALLSPFLALGGAIWDWIALMSGDAISGPELANRYPDAVFLLGIPFGSAILALGWLLARPHRSQDVRRAR